MDIDKSNLWQYELIGNFKSLEACREAAMGKLRKSSSYENGDYECGLNCKLNEHGLFICKKTLR